MRSPKQIKIASSLSSMDSEVGEVVKPPAKQRTVIGGHLPAEVDCHHCQAHVITRTKKVLEWSGSCCFGLCLPITVFLFGFMLVFLLVSWLNQPPVQEIRSPSGGTMTITRGENTGTVLCGLIMVCAALGCCLYSKFGVRCYPRIQHICPNCDKKLADVEESDSYSLHHV